eukprot:XP_015572752.1 uncharacterized protein LOC107260991 [Ricinus communis]
MRHSLDHDDIVYSLEVLDDIVEFQLQEILLDDPLQLALQADNEELSNEDVLEQLSCLLASGPSRSTKNFVDIYRSGVQKLRTSLEEQPTLELKELPKHLTYAYLDEAEELPVIIAAYLTLEKREMTLASLRKYPKAFAYKIADIPGINPSYCLHKILMEDNYRLVVVPKKGGMTMVKNEMDELIPTRMITGFRVRIDYRRLNDATRKNHFPLHFIDQILERLLGHMRISFGLCNALATFQRCMMAIFHDMIEESMEVFMDDFLAFELLKEKLTTTPIMVSPNWGLPFELMCDASDFAVRAVLGQRLDKKFQPIYYASKKLTYAQEHYTTSDMELLVVVYAFDKFRSYLVLSKTVVYTDHSVLRHLFGKHNAKPRLIYWILLLQDFDIKMKDKKGAKNLAADHLSRLENPNLDALDERAINDSFSDEYLCSIQVSSDIPWFSDFANHLVAKVIRRCIYEEEIIQILRHYHEGPTGGHQAANHTTRKVLDTGFYWPTIFRDARAFMQVNRDSGNSMSWMSGASKLMATHSSITSGLRHGTTRG